MKTAFLEPTYFYRVQTTFDLTYTLYVSGHNVIVRMYRIFRPAKSNTSGQISNANSILIKFLRCSTEFAKHSHVYTMSRYIISAMFNDLVSDIKLLIFIKFRETFEGLHYEPIHNFSNVRNRQN
jgi:hypothetical protein